MGRPKQIKKVKRYLVYLPKYGKYLSAVDGELRSGRRFTYTENKALGLKFNDIEEARNMVNRLQTLGAKLSTVEEYNYV